LLFLATNVVRINNIKVRRRCNPPTILLPKLKNKTKTTSLPHPSLSKH
jgi:hypothetical protein